MVLAVTHSLISAFYVFLVKKGFNLRFINNNHLFVAAVAGILPDLDIIIRCFNNLLNLNLPEILGHRGLFHTPFWEVLLFSRIFRKFKYCQYFIPSAKKSCYFIVITSSVYPVIYLCNFLQ